MRLLKPPPRKGGVWGTLGSTLTNPNPLRKEGCGEPRFPFTYRRGAEEARRAHNSEDVGSKPTAGILFVPEKKWSYPAIVRILTLP